MSKIKLLYEQSDSVTLQTIQAHIPSPHICIYEGGENACLWANMQLTHDYKKQEGTI